MIRTDSALYRNEECHYNENLQEEYNVQGVPYIVLFLKGKKVFDFSGANTKKLEEAVEMAKKDN